MYSVLNIGMLLSEKVYLLQKKNEIQSLRRKCY